MASNIAMWFYRLLEIVDGERGKQVISYKLAERWKMRLLAYIK